MSIEFEQITKPRVDLDLLPKLPLQLQGNPDFLLLYRKINTIITEVHGFNLSSRKNHLRSLTQRAAILHVSLKIALQIAKNEETRVPNHANLWGRAIIALAACAQEVWHLYLSHFSFLSCENIRIG